MYTCFILALYLICINATDDRRKDDNEYYPSRRVLPATALVSLPKWFVNGQLIGLNRLQYYDTIHDDNQKRNSTLGLPKNAFHGRYAEDRLAIEHLFFGMIHGLLVEVGSNDGFIFSTSYVFDKYLKWRTVLIEGDPVIASQIPKYRPESLALNSVVCKNFQSVLFSPMGTLGGILDYMTDTFLEKWYFRGDDKRETYPTKYCLPKVECVPLGWILDQLDLTIIDFLMIDLNGAEFETLQSIDLNSVIINVIALSTASKDDNYRKEIMKYMEFKYPKYIHLNITTHLGPSLSYKSSNPLSHQILWFVINTFTPSSIYVQ